MAVEVPPALKIEMAQRSHRMAHYLWHGTRNGWERMSAAQRQAIAAIDPGWVPPRPALDAAGSPLRDNLSGEDFLYMHRQMIALANQILQRAGAPPVQGW
ncbi:MAG: Tat pathway signal protein, partial [Myxococcota bacterium]